VRTIPPIRGYSPRTRKSPLDRECVVADAVSIELVSFWSRDSRGSAKLTANLYEPRSRPRGDPISAHKVNRLSAIPYRGNREFFRPDQGIEFLETAKPPAAMRQLVERGPAPVHNSTASSHSPKEGCEAPGPYSQFLSAMVKVPTRTRSELSNPRSAVTMRDLTDEDAEALEQALGKPIDRKFLVQRVSQITREIVRLAIQPKPQDYRPELRRIAQQGRVWIRNVEECPAQSMLRASNFEQMKAEVARFCDQVDAIRRQHVSAKTGPPRRRQLLQLFIGEMIGIAKRAKVLPSTPSRAISPKRPRPPFFVFVETALTTAQKIVLSSSLTEGQREAALSVFIVEGYEALVKQIELVRGRIGEYRDSPHGLLEWSED
jgi:hypothetical protein